jgi:hypothetical protein
MMMTHDNNGGHMDASDRDLECEELLSVLDPAATRPGYWQGFHLRVIEAGRFELARRRRLADLTIAGTVTSWARTVVPSACVAAAAAAVILLVVPAPPQGDAELGIEELLSAGLEGEPVPAELEEDARSGLTFASAEIF